MDVIGAGLGRTGTRSLKDALEVLGFGPAYHMSDLFQNPAGLRHWQDAEAGRTVDWAALFAGYRAVVDYPGALYWRQLLVQYPGARVVLSVRPANDWYDSVADTIYEAHQRSWAGSIGQVMDGVGPAIWDGLFCGRFTDRDHAIRVFEAHNASVIAEVPSERLLVYTLGQGWGPLAAFLGVAAPEEPFPRRNGRAEFVDRLSTL